MCDKNTDNLNELTFIYHKKIRLPGFVDLTNPTKQESDAGIL